MYETRKRLIFDLVNRKGSASVTELIQILAVSDNTVRRDIKSMAREGLVKRVHGGATVLSLDGEEKPFASRRIEEQARKRAIAELAITFLKDGESVFIDGSTTCSELSRLLASGRRHTVVTDSLSVLLELSGKPGIELVLLGGALDRDGNTFDGLLAVESARRVQVDRCFFSSRGFSIDGISNAGMIGSQVKQIMIQNSARCILLADSTKHGQSGVIRLCGWREVDVLVTDTGLPEDIAEAIGRAGTEVLRAPFPGEPT